MNLEQLTQVDIAPLRCIVLLVHPFIDRTDMSAPAPPLTVLHGRDVIVRPMEVIGDKRYFSV